MWQFWLVVIGFILAIVGIILVFATDLGWVAWLIFAFGILFIILGIIFWLRRKKPPPPKGLRERIARDYKSLKRMTPGVRELDILGERLGIQAWQDKNRAAAKQFVLAKLKSSPQDIKKTASTINKYLYKYRYPLIASTGPFNPFLTTALGFATVNYDIRAAGKRRASKKQQAADLQQLQYQAAVAQYNKQIKEAQGEEST